MTNVASDNRAPTLKQRLRRISRHPAARVALRGRLMRPLRVRRFHHFGVDSVIDRPVFLLGEDYISVGDAVLVLKGCSLSIEGPAWNKPPPVLRIGDRVGIRPYCTISVCASVTIEDDVIIGSFSSIVDSDHTFDAGNPHVMHNPVRAAPIRIGKGTWLAERVAVLAGTDIGRCCMIGANSVVKGTIPDFSIAVGSPARVVGTVEGVDADRPPVSSRMW